MLIITAKQCHAQILISVQFSDREADKAFQWLIFFDSCAKLILPDFVNGMSINRGSKNHEKLQQKTNKY